MKLTIGISNRNRDWFLDRSIYLLSKQTMPQDEWELIIVDDGSTDQSDDVILKYKKMNIIKNFYYIKNTVKRHDLPGSPARTCNMVAKESSGDYLLYTDPEIMPLPDWFEHHYSSHKGRTNTVMYGKCLHPREYHIIEQSATCRGAFLGNAYTDYDWFNIENVWEIMNEKMQKVKTDFNLTEFSIQNEFFNNYQGGFSISRKYLFELRGFEEDFCDKSLGLDIYGGLDVLFNGYLVRTNAVIIRPDVTKAIHIYHPQDSRDGKGYDWAFKYAYAHPDQKCSNLNREWGLIKEHGFVKVF